MTDECHHGNERTRCAFCEQSPFQCASAIAFGLMGMAFAIRGRHCDFEDCEACKRAMEGLCAEPYDGRCVLHGTYHA